MVKKNADRARQFLPFNSLRGYYDLVRKEEIIKTDKKTLDEDEAQIVSNNLAKLRRGMLVKITYYQDYGYTSIEGMVSNIDYIYHTITIVSKMINFSDIIKVIIPKEDKLYFDK